MQSGNPDSRGSWLRTRWPGVAAGGWRLYAGLGVSLVALTLALRDVDLAGVGAAIGATDGRLLGLALGSYLLTVTVKAVRWRLLLSMQTAPSLSRAFSVLSIGMLVNALVPARLGELVRAYLMGESASPSKAFVLGTIAVEKLLELSNFALAVALLLSQVALPVWLVEPVRASALVLVSLSIAVALLAWQRTLAVGALNWVAGKGLVGPGWLARQTEQGLQSLDFLRRPRLMLGILFWTFVVLVLGASTNYLVCAALGLSLPVWAPLFLLVVLQAGVAVPSSPGKIGVFHYLTVLALSVFGVPREAALGCGVLLHLIIYLPTATIGVWCLWRESLTWRKLTEAAGRLKENAQETR
jgi:uncharacterized membrane protein YbhN (UPF0104 family)